MVLTLAVCGCDEPSSPKGERSPAPKSKSESCPEMKFDAIALPVTFTISKRRDLIGTVTIDDGHNITFEPSENAQPKDLDRFRTEFDRQLSSGKAMYRYMGNGDDPGDYIMCRGEVAQGEPSYPAAFKFALQSHRFRVE